MEVYLLCEILTSKDTLQGQKKLLRASLIELRYLINLFIHYLPEMTFKKCKRQCY